MCTGARLYFWRLARGFPTRMANDKVKACLLCSIMLCGHSLTVGVV